MRTWLTIRRLKASLRFGWSGTPRGMRSNREAGPIKSCASLAQPGPTFKMGHPVVEIAVGGPLERTTFASFCHSKTTLFFAFCQDSQRRCATP